MKVAIVLVLSYSLAANAIFFDDGRRFGGESVGGRRFFENTHGNDERALGLDLGDEFFDGQSLHAAAGHDKAAHVGLEGANQDVLKVDFNHAKNKQTHHVDQSKTSLSFGKGRKNFIDFDAKAASSDKAAVKHDQARKEGTHVNAKEAQDRDFFHQLGEQDFNRGLFD